MNRTVKLFFSILGIIISLGIVIITIGYEKIVSSTEYLIIEEDLTFNNQYIEPELNVWEVVIIVVAFLLFIISLSYLTIHYLGITLIYNEYNKYIYPLLLIITTGLLSSITIWIANECVLTSEHLKEEIAPYNISIIRQKGHVEVTTTILDNNKNYSSRRNDENVLLIKSKGYLTADNYIIIKRGNSSNIINANTYGTNAAIAVSKNSKLLLKNSNIETKGKGAIGLFVTLDKSLATIQNTIIETTGEGSSGITASFGGHINANNIRIKTNSLKSPAVSTIKKANAIIQNSILETTSSSSPLLYTRSNLTLEDSLGTTQSSSIATIENGGNLNIFGSQLVCSSTNESSYEASIIISNNPSHSNYQDSTILTIKDSELGINERSRAYNHIYMFDVDSANAIINLENSDLSFGSNKLLNVTSKLTNKVIRVVLNGANQTLDGDIVIDKYSTLELNLHNSLYNGTINGKNKANKITLRLDKDSTISLTGDSYVTIIDDSLEDYSNIKTNGYTLYYSEKQNPKLKGETILLDNGGKLEAR